jgi:hypothetical protein
VCVCASVITVHGVRCAETAARPATDGDRRATAAAAPAAEEAGHVQVRGVYVRACARVCVCVSSVWSHVRNATVSCRYLARLAHLRSATTRCRPRSCRRDDMPRSSSSSTCSWNSSNRQSHDR